MTKIVSWLQSKDIARTDEEGQGLAEYGLILALVSVTAVLALQGLSGGINGVLGSITGHL